jgi:hypothetical protein
MPGHGHYGHGAYRGASLRHHDLIYQASDLLAPMLASTGSIWEDWKFLVGTVGVVLITVLQVRLIQNWDSPFLDGMSFLHKIKTFVKAKKFTEFLGLTVIATYVFFNLSILSTFQHVGSTGAFVVILIICLAYNVAVAHAIPRLYQDPPKKKTLIRQNSLYGDFRQPLLRVIMCLGGQITVSLLFCHGAVQTFGRSEINYALWLLAVPTFQ